MLVFILNEQSVAARPPVYPQAKLGTALNESFGEDSRIASVSNMTRGRCADSSVTMSIPRGHAVDAVLLHEDLSAGQAIAGYSVRLSLFTRTASVGPISDCTHLSACPL